MERRAEAVTGRALPPPRPYIEAPSAGHRSNGPLLIGLVTVATVLLSIGLSPHIHTGGRVRRAAVFVHLIALVVGFGATFAIDAYGLLWLFGRRTVVELRRMVAAAHLLVWVGVYGLTVSGTLLAPSLERTRTQVKLVLVVVAVVNGAWSLTFLPHLPALSAAGTRPARRIVHRALVSAAVSQVCWWGATVVGFLTTMSRRG